MKKGIFLFCASAAILALLSSCGKSGSSSEGPAQPTEKTFTSKDGKVALTLPLSWDEYESSEGNIILSIENEAAGIDAFMFSDPKKDFTAASYLEEHLAGLKEANEGVEFTVPSPLSVNGISAAYCEYTERVDDGTDKYIIVTYEINDSIYELLVSSNEDQFETNKEAMLRVVNSLKTL